jgi:Flp pilus assembly protein TadG
MATGQRRPVGNLAAATSRKDRPLSGLARAGVLAAPLRRWREDARGNILTTFALTAPMLLGAAGLGVDMGRWELAHKGLQRAADSAAISAAVAYQANTTTDLTQQAAAVAASYNLTTEGGASITVNRPPLTGAYRTNSNAVEVIVAQPQGRLFSRLFGQGSVSEHGRAVAVGSSKACVLALDPTASGGVSVQGAVGVQAPNCALYADSNSSNAVNDGGGATIEALQVGAVGDVSGQSNITATNGIVQNGGVIADPYADVAMPSYSGCDSNNYSTKRTVTIYPGVYCNGFTLNAGANVTMAPGVYFMDRGSFTINGQATLTGTGVTIVFTSSTGSNYATAKVAGGANVNLTAPTSGPLAGIVLFGDRSMPVGTSFSLAGGSTQSFGGATYLPEAAVSYAGGASGYNGCSQVIGDTVSFAGNSNLSINCAGSGTKQIGAAAQLLE